MIGVTLMTSSELEAFFGWLVESGVAGEGYVPRRLVEDYLKAARERAEKKEQAWQKQTLTKIERKHKKKN